MKVVCDGCQAKYKLTDGRLAGRTLKFRCRKCGNTIVIDGAEFGSPWGQSQRPTRSTDEFAQEAVGAFESAPPEWYLSINGEPYGPCTTDQMSSLLCDGQVPWETYVWREGYADWKSASESDTLVAAAEELFAQSGAEPGADDAVGRQEFDEDDWSAGSSQGQRLPSLAQAEAERASYPVGEYSGPGAGSEDASFGSAYAQSARVHDEPTRVAYVDPVTGKSAFGDHEASGLIDIRALAALTGVARNSAHGERYGHTLDDHARSGRSAEGGRPDTLAPVARGRAPRSKAIPFAILSGSAVIATATVIAIYSSSATTSGSAAAATTLPDEAPIGTVAEPEGAPRSSVATSTPAAQPGAQTSPGARESAGSRVIKWHHAPSRDVKDVKEVKEVKLGAADGFEKPSGSAPAAATDAASRGNPPSAGTDGALKPAKKAPASAPAVADDLLADAERPKSASPDATQATQPAAAAKPRAGSRSLDELLDDAVPNRDQELDTALAPATSARAAPGAAGLPSTPSRDQVVAAMRAIDPDLHACTLGQSLDTFTAAASFTVVGSTGRVGNVRMTGVQGAVGECMARAVRNAIFPPFSKGQLRINFPFRLGP